MKLENFFLEGFNVFFILLVLVEALLLIWGFGGLAFGQPNDGSSIFIILVLSIIGFAIIIFVFSSIIWIIKKALSFLEPSNKKVKM